MSDEISKSQFLIYHAEEEAPATDASLKKMSERIGARTALSARIENVSQLADKAVRAPLPGTP